MKTRPPWVLLPADETDSLIFEAAFPLPDDGTGPNLLVVQVRMDTASSAFCDITLINRTFKDRILGCINVRTTDLANALYGFATIRTVPTLTLL